jgi:bisphosphoglycerate-independent phosphoglycerate mutase (AlkP superfamily)
MHILMIFLDGIGLGENNPLTNPFAAAALPTVMTLTNGQRWLRDTLPQSNPRASFLSVDVTLGVAGKPQSGTGQAALLTGRNIPQLVGRHFGPKPDAMTRQLLEADNIFKQVIAHGKTAALINAYPPGLLNSIARGKTLRSSIQHAVYAANLPLFDASALYAGDAMSEDWTGSGWREHLAYADTPLYTPYEAGQKMVELSRRYDFAFFSHWLTDMIGHRGTLEEAVALIEVFDQVMAGALDIWDDNEGVMLITSDHGNFEAMDTRHHTENPTPLVIIGAQLYREHVTHTIHTVMDVVPYLAQVLGLRAE